MIATHNQKTYTTSDVVSYYAQLSQLQPAEATILQRFQKQWHKMRLLDIGVGGGRTSQHFAPLVAEYVGIDYSPEMIAACQKRFPRLSSQCFQVCDVRDLSQFEDNSFDFILFSFNGIDYVSHEERLKVFQEIARIGKSGGYFFFSTHNLQGIVQEFEVRNKFSFNPLKTYVNLVMFAILRLANRSLSLTQLKTSTHAIIKDESHNFRLKTYYVNPLEQLNQLSTNFCDVQIYSWKTGLEITSQADLDVNTDMWLYYLCVIR